MAAPAVGGVRAERRVGPLAFLVATAAAAAALTANVVLSEVRAGNAWSVGYGIGAAALLVLAAGYGLRRRVMRTASRWRAGNAAAWLTLHLWGGGLFLLLMLMHSGFRLPSGRVTGWLWALSWWTVVSGLGGRLLQRWIPRLLASGLSTEILYERIPELVEEIRGRAEKVAAEAQEAVRTLYERRLAAQLARPRRRLLYFVDITGASHRRLKEFRYLRPLLAAEEQERLDRLEGLFRTKLEIDAHYTLQQALRLWLHLHVPTSVLVVVLLMIHLYSVWAY